MSRRTLAIVLVGLVALTAAGCGGKKKSASSATSSTPAASSSSSSSSSSSGAPSFTSAKNCAQLASLAAKVTQSVGANGQFDLAKESDAIEALANAAPGEIKGDFKTFADAFAGYVKAYKDSGLKAGQTPTAAQLTKFANAAKQLSTPKVQAAMARLSAWGTKHCGGLTGTNG